MPTTSPDDNQALFAALDRVVDEEQWPVAVSVDAMDTIPNHHFDALGALGLHGMAVPRALGGLGLDPPSFRRVLRVLSRGCAATAFAFAQHHGVAAALARTANKALAARWLEAVRTDTLAGTAFAHVRRAGAATLRAEPDGDGWRLSGEAPWATSWGMAEVFSVAATAPDGRIVWVLAPGSARPGLTPSDPLRLLVFGSTATVRLCFDNFAVAGADVLSVEEAEPWRHADRRAAVRVNPLGLGVGDRALLLLADVDPEAAEAWVQPWAAMTAEADAAAVAVDEGSAEVDAVAVVRTRTLLMVQQLTTTYLAAVGGKGAELTHPAQLLARQSLFCVVQAQNAEGRLATLAATMP